MREKKKKKLTKFTQYSDNQESGISEYKTYRKCANPSNLACQEKRQTGPSILGCHNPLIQLYFNYY